MGLRVLRGLRGLRGLSGLSGLMGADGTEGKEGTEYQVRGRGKEGFSEGWVPARGLREGCATSPVLFNVFHQAVMRQAEEARGREGDVGVGWRWVPGGSFAGAGNWEKECTEAKEVRVRLVLFADDTTIVGERGELSRGVDKMKEVDGAFHNKELMQVRECGVHIFKIIKKNKFDGKIKYLVSWQDYPDAISNGKHRQSYRT